MHKMSRVLSLLFNGFSNFKISHTKFECQKTVKFGMRGNKGQMIKERQKKEVGKFRFYLPNSTLLKKA